MINVETHASPFEDGALYDVLTHGFDYGLDFYVAAARQARGPILDIACGTGRILLPCLQAGADGDGLDLHEGMLARLRAKAQVLGFAPGIYGADMCEFQLPRRYALIMITFNAFIHNLTQEAQIGCLRCCREHLLPGGMLVFDTFFPGWHVIGAEPGTRVLEGEIQHPETGETIRVFDTRTFRRVEQIQHSINDYEFVNAAGEVTRIVRTEFETRWVYKAEMEALLRLGGFDRWEIAGDWNLRPLTNETDIMLVRAWNDPTLDGSSGY